jgi:hypothetical protein
METIHNKVAEQSRAEQREKGEFNGGLSAALGREK